VALNPKTGSFALIGIPMGPKDEAKSENAKKTQIHRARPANQKGAGP